MELTVLETISIAIKDRESPRSENAKRDTESIAWKSDAGDAKHMLSPEDALRIETYGPTMSMMV